MNSPRSTRLLHVLSITLVGLVACRPEAPSRTMEPPSTTAELGRAMYEAPLSDGNSFACATCHALAEPTADGLRRPGHPLGDATRRRTWKNGKAPTFLAAVNSCLEEWMGSAPWEGTEPRFVAL